MALITFIFTILKAELYFVSYITTCYTLKMILKNFKSLFVVILDFCLNIYFFKFNLIVFLSVTFELVLTIKIIKVV